MKNLAFLIAMAAPVVGFAQKDTVKIGLYINRLYDFDLLTDAYSVEAWLWFVNKDSTIKWETACTIANAKSQTLAMSDKKKRGNQFYWSYLHKYAQIHHDWQTQKFPFDNQILRIELETDQDEQEQAIIFDKESSGVARNAASQGWKLDESRFYTQKINYPTSFGDPELKGSTTYETLVTELVLQRNNRWLTFLKLVVGLWVAFLVAAMAFLVPAIYNTPKFSASVGGLWAAIGNKHIADMYVPSSDSISLIDAMHLFTFGCMLSIICIAVYTLTLQHREEHEKVVLVNKMAFRILLGLYFVVNIALVVWANT